MSRPHPKILLEVTNRITNSVEQIVEADALWAVFYKDKPMNLKNETVNGDIKYKRFSFANSGHAVNLAKKLNRQFNCADFSVYKLTSGTKIS